VDDQRFKPAECDLSTIGVDMEADLVLQKAPRPKIVVAANQVEFFALVT